MNSTNENNVRIVYDKDSKSVVLKLVCENGQEHIISLSEIGFHSTVININMICYILVALISISVIILIK